MKPGCIDLTDPDNFNQGFPHEYFRMLRKEDPVSWSECGYEPDRNGRGFWSITKYEDVKMMSRSPHTYSSHEGGTNIFELDGEDLIGARSMMLNMDPPQHAKYRRLVAHNFTPRMIEKLHGHIRELAAKIVDDIAARGECDFVADVAALLPMHTIMEIVGVPEEDRQAIWHLSNRLIGFDDPEFQHSFDEGKMAAAEMCMFGNKIREQVAECPRDDLASALYHGQVDGESLDPFQYNYFFLMLMLAGNETTRTTTSHGMRLLMEHPEQIRLLQKDPSLVPNAVEEILRHNPAVMYFRRTLMEDVELRGRQLKKGDKVVLWYPSANRDEEVYQDPDRFDVTRPIQEHLAFGNGEHFCLGASFARAQLSSIFTEVCTRLPDMQLAAAPRYLRSNFIDGIKEMRVRFTPEAVRPQAACPHAAAAAAAAEKAGAEA